MMDNERVGQVANTKLALFFSENNLANIFIEIFQIFQILNIHLKSRDP